MFCFQEMDIKKAAKQGNKQVSRLKSNGNTKLVT